VPPSMAGLAVGAVDLDDAAPGTPEVARQAGSVGAGALEAEPRGGVAETLGPPEQPTVAGGSGGDLEVPQGPPQIAGESRGNVDLTVGVDANGDAARGLVCNVRRSHPHILEIPASGA
jgi:hypothetical protein